MHLRNYIEDIMEDHTTVSINNQTVSTTTNAVGLCMSKPIGTLIVITKGSRILGRLRRTGNGVEEL